MENPDADWLQRAWATADELPVPLVRSDCFHGLRIVTPPLTDSTNRLLWQWQSQGYAPPLAAIAAQQTAGRGQWGRYWRSEPGGLYLSVMLAVNLPVTHAPHLVLLSAWGIAYGLQRHGIAVRLKWPNDLLLNGRKLGGIKTETKISDDIIQTAVIGVGINWSNSVPETGIALKPFCDQVGIDSVQSLGDLAEITLAGLTLGWQRYQQRGIASILEGYLDFFAHRGQTIELPQGSGVIEAVTESGELVVSVQGQLQLVAPGDISLGYHPAGN